MIFIKLLGKFIKVLRSAASPNQLAWGFALGSILGLTPIKSLHNLVVVLLLIILNVNVTSAFFALLLYKTFAFLLDPLFHNIGYYVLVQIPAMQPTWIELYNAAIAPFTRFNNTIVMGSLIVSIVLLLPNYLFFKWFVKRYRESWNDKIMKWKISKALLGNKVVQFYFKVRDLGD